MSLVREPGLQPIAQFDAPVRGTLRSLAAHKVPQDALYDSMNVYLREGKLHNRPGLVPLNASIFTRPVLGAAMVVTPYEKRLLAITAHTLFELGESDSQWLGTATYDTTPKFANSDSETIDIAFIQAANTYTALIANEHWPLKGWDATTHTTVELSPEGGSVGIPLAKSVCIAARRVVCLVPPHTIRWSKTFNIDYYDPLAYTTVAQSNDMGICVRSISTLSFVVYKERSIYIARAQAGGEDTAFAFNEPLMVEGPAGVHAVVDIPGADMYMTRNGRVAIFDGTSYPQWIADGLWLFLQEDIDPVYAHLIHGVFDYRLHTVTFWYPRVGDAGLLRGMLIVNLPLIGNEVQGTQPSMACFRGRSGVAVSYGCEMRFANTIDRSILFTATPYAQQSCLYSEQAKDDVGTVFLCGMQTGLVAMPNAQHGQMTSEYFFERGQGYGSVIVEPVVSDGLEVKAGTVPDLVGQYINLEANPILQYKGFNKLARFFGLKYSWDSRSTVRYAGGVLYGKAVV